MNRIEIHYTATSRGLAARRLANRDADVFLAAAVQAVGQKDLGAATWVLHVQADALFDQAGLQAVVRAITSYRGPASRLELELKLPLQAWRDYYSLQCDEPDERGALELPMHAERRGGDGSTASVTVELDWIESALDFPRSLREPVLNQTPSALLMRHSCDHDLLFANQILVFAELACELRRAPKAWLAACFSRLAASWTQRVALHHKRIHPSARVHPTAVIEGSTIGPGCRIGAHCVVRYSRLGERVQMHDGAKVEFSMVDDDCWLMHDLVLYRCHVEPDVFLIHGPYQFSCFQRGSAAFATIMMDYRPDGLPIKVGTPAGLRAYTGAFLGALMLEGSKALGGSLLAPGLCVPRGTVVGPQAEQVIRPKTLGSFSAASDTLRPPSGPRQSSSPSSIASKS